VAGFCVQTAGNSFIHFGGRFHLDGELVFQDHERSSVVSERKAEASLRTSRAGMAAVTASARQTKLSGCGLRLDEKTAPELVAYLHE
jgi:hypothetical protein